MAKIDYKDRISVLNKALAERQKALVGVADAVQIEEKTVKDDEGREGKSYAAMFDSDKQAESNKLVKELRDITNEINAATLGMEVAEYLAQPEGKSFGLGLSGQQMPAGSYAKTLGEHVLDHEMWEEVKANQGQRGKSWTIPLDASLRNVPVKPERKDIYSARGGEFTRPGFGSGLDIVEQMMRTARVRDLFPVDTTTDKQLEFLRETGFTNNAAAIGERESTNATTGVTTPVAPGTVGGTNFALKPNSDIEFEPAIAPIRLIAHWIRAHKTVLADEPRLRAIIDSRMMYGIKLEEDWQLLLGDGAGENIEGIMQVEGTQVYAQGQDGHTEDRKSFAVRRALTRVLVAQYEATGVVVNPFDWEDIELEVDAQGRLVVALNVVDGAQARLWRVPIVPTVAMPEGKFLTGAFGLGAKVWDREQAQVTISTEDSDNFRRNAVTILAEERVGLEVTRPEAFVVGTFTP